MVDFNSAKDFIVTAAGYSLAFAIGAFTHHWLIENTSFFLKGKKDSECSTDDESDADWEGKDESSWEPHKMILVVRMDLKMGKGKVAAQCSHATLGAYRRALRRTPNALKGWEMFGQAKVCVKVNSEEELLEIADNASNLGLVNYLVVDAGRTQLAPDTKTVLGIGPAPIEKLDQITGHLKLL